jgi:hypothetical protein
MQAELSDGLFIKNAPSQRFSIWRILFANLVFVRRSRWKFCWKIRYEKGMDPAVYYYTCVYVLLYMPIDRGVQPRYPRYTAVFIWVFTGTGGCPAS